MVRKKRAVPTPPKVFRSFAKKDFATGGTKKVATKVPPKKKTTGRTVIPKALESSRFAKKDFATGGTRKVATKIPKPKKTETVQKITSLSRRGFETVAVEKPIQPTAVRTTRSQSFQNVEFGKPAPKPEFKGKPLAEARQRKPIQRSDSLEKITRLTQQLTTDKPRPEPVASAGKPLRQKRAQTGSVFTIPKALELERFGDPDFLTGRSSARPARTPVRVREQRDVSRAVPLREERKPNLSARFDVQLGSTRFKERRFESGGVTPDTGIRNIGVFDNFIGEVFDIAKGDPTLLAQLGLSPERKRGKKKFAEPDFGF